MDHSASGPKIMMMAKPVDSSEERASFSPISAVALPPPMMAGPPTNFLNMALEGQVVQQMKMIETQMALQMSKMNEIEKEID